MLRRLPNGEIDHAYECKTQLERDYDEALAELARLRSINDELVEACTNALIDVDDYVENDSAVVFECAATVARNLRAAIAKATERGDE